MSDNIIQLNEQVIKAELKDLVKQSVEETLNNLLDQEAAELTNASKYERTEQRKGYRSGHYTRNLHTSSGNVTLKVPKLKGIPFETAIIERYRRRESSVEEALIEMYLAGVSVRRIEDITEALWGTKVSPGTISNLNKKAYGHIETWRNRQLPSEEYPYVFIDGIYLKRRWGGAYENVAILVAIAVNRDGFREVVGAVHFFRNIFSVVPRKHGKEVGRMLKAIHAQEDKVAALEKANLVAEKLRKMKLNKAADKLLDGIAETLTYMDFPEEHWKKIRTNNAIERLNREIRRRTRVIGTFPDGESALMLVCARLRHVVNT